MAVRIANLKILVSANTTGLSTGLTKAKTRVSSFRGTVTGLGSSLKKAVPIIAALTAGLASFATVSRLVSEATRQIVQQFAELDKLGKTASKIGVATDALQKMRFAGKLAGVEVNTVDMALQRFVRRTAEAAAGTGEALGAFKELRIDAEGFARLSLEDQMKELADAMGEFSDNDQLRLAFKLFDSEGAALVNTLKGGSEALDAMFRERAALGLFTPTQVSRIESANDEMTKLGIQVKFVAGSIAAELSPQVTELGKRLNMMGKGGKFDFGQITTGLEETAKGVAFIVDNVNNLQKVLDGMVAIGPGQATVVRELLSGLASLTGLEFIFETPSQRKVAEFFEASRRNSEAIAENMRDANRKVGGSGAFLGFGISAAGGDGTSLSAGLTAAIATLPAALEKGSVGAFSLSAKGGQARKMDAIAKWTQQAAEQSVEQTEILIRIEDSFATPIGAADV